MARVIQKKKGFKLDFDLILKVFFTLFAAAILVLVVDKVIERVENNKKPAEVTALFPVADYKDAYVRYNYEEGLDGFFEDEGFIEANTKNGHDGAVFVFVYNSNLEVYVDKTLEDEEDQNELKNFITEDFNENRGGVQSFYQLAVDYIEKLNVDGKKVIYLLDLYSFDNYYGQILPGSNLTLYEDTLAVAQISFHNEESSDNKIDRNYTFSFSMGSYSSTYDDLNGILGQIAKNNA